ncbi:MAG TPA: M23 family metallopeptidase [Woeseiaceae bacterium]|nr:M23 family metallopeptidase [Woeseiaceae bacterium]
MRDRSIPLTGLIAAACCLSGCDTGPQPEAARQAPTHAEYAAALAQSDLAGTLVADGWLHAADAALDLPTVTNLPHNERGVFLPYETRAVGLGFYGVDEQRFRIDVETSADSTGRLFVELFLLEDEDGTETRREVATFTDLAGGILPLPEAGRYVLRLQPELLARIDYHLRLELAAALEFPVSGHDRGDIGGVFGDPRDGGRRRHEGLDIFAPRDTPVVAVADGVAVASRSRLGGNTVWLRGHGKSYYYAHLASTAFGGRRDVRAGDVLGYVGNSGNAANTPPHLHFGIYRRGQGAVDPAPYIAERRFAVPPPAPAFEGGYAAVAAAALNLRAGPGRDQAATETLARGTVLRVLATTGEWLSVQTPAAEGWVHADYRAPLRPVAAASLGTDAWLHDRPVPGQSASTRLYAGADVRIFARLPGWRLVGRGSEPLGWADEATLAPPP